LNKSFASILKYVLLLAIAFGLLYLALREVDLKKSLDDILHANFFWLSASILVALVAFLSRAYRWILLVEPLGYKPRLLKTTYALMIGYLANLAFPRLGEITRCGSLSKAEKLPFNILVGTVITERLIDVVCLLISMIITAFIQYERLGTFIWQELVSPITARISASSQSLAMILVVISFMIILIALVIWFIRESRKPDELSKTMRLVRGLIDGIFSIGRLKRPWAFVFHSILIWVMYFLMAYLAFFALPATSSLQWDAGMLILVVGGIAMSAPVNGGIGLYHILVAKALMLYGLNNQDGKTFATLLHSTQMLIVIFFGALSFLLLFLASKKKTDDNAGENQKQNSYT
jgi:uncharacterized membrane protein YbhN (UPF0104 family)